MCLALADAGLLEGRGPGSSSSCKTRNRVRLVVCSQSSVTSHPGCPIQIGSRCAGERGTWRTVRPSLCWSIWSLGHVQRPGKWRITSTRSFSSVFLYLTGLRRSEVAQASTADLVQRRGQWWLHVSGKGHTGLPVPVAQDALDVLQAYRISLGRSPWPNPHQPEPLLMDL